MNTNTQTSLTLLLCVVAAAALIAPWGLRLIAFSTALAIDKLLDLSRRRNIRLDQPRAFLARGIGKAPARTYGFLTRDGSGNVVFVYRPWFFLSKRAVIVHSGSLGIFSGTLYPSLWAISAGDEQHLIIANFLPRYRSLDNLIAAHLSAYPIANCPPANKFNAKLTRLLEILTPNDWATR